MGKHQKADQATWTEVDDFKLINGITPDVENRLHRAEIHTYAELASFAPKEILPNLGNPKGYSIRRIKEEDWIGQSQKLALTEAGRKSQTKETARPRMRQHYENFTLEFLLDEKKRTRRTRVTHVQSGDADTWAGWELEHVLDFIARHTGIRLLPTRSGLPMLQQTTMLPAPSKASEQASKLMVETASMLPVRRSSERPDLPAPLLSSEDKSTIQESATYPLAESNTQTLPSHQDMGISAQKIHLLEWKISMADTQQSVRNPAPDQAFNVHLILDLSQTSITHTSQISYVATLSSKKLGDGYRHLIGETKSTAPFDNTLSLNINCAALASGTYRLEALVNVKLSQSEVEQQPDLMAFFESGPLQVY